MKKGILVAALGMLLTLAALTTGTQRAAANPLPPSRLQVTCTLEGQVYTVTYYEYGLVFTEHIQLSAIPAPYRAYVLSAVINKYCGNVNTCINPTISPSVVITTETC